MHESTAPQRTVPNDESDPAREPGDPDGASAFGMGVDAVLTAVDVASSASEDAERLRSTIAALDDGIAIIDPSGRIDQVNDAFCRLVGRTQTQVRNRSVFDPPWVFRDLGDRATTPEESAAVICLRTGQPAVGPVWSTALSRTERTSTRMSAHPLADGAVVVLEDLTTETGLRSELARRRDTDELTGLSTRRSIYAHLAALLHPDGSDQDEGTVDRTGSTLSTDRSAPRRVGVLHVNLDNFRTVNDTFGPSIGDQVLVQMADRLRDLSNRPADSNRVRLGRVGVDEFLLVVDGAAPSLAFDVELRRLGEEVHRRLQPPIALHGLDVRLTASIGVARSPGDANEPERLLAAAHRALATGRLEGRNRLRFYEPQLDAATRTGLALDRDLRRAAAARQLEVHYQPIIDLRTGSIAMAEALVRWYHPVEGPIPPSVFIPSAEATGAIGAVSDLVLSTVARDVAQWTRDQVAALAVDVDQQVFLQTGQLAVGGELVAAVVRAGGRRQHLHHQAGLTLDQPVAQVGGAAGDHHVGVEEAVGGFHAQLHVAAVHPACRAAQVRAQRHREVQGHGVVAVLSTGHGKHLAAHELMLDRLAGVPGQELGRSHHRALQGISHGLLHGGQGHAVKSSAATPRMRVFPRSVATAVQP